MKYDVSINYIWFDKDVMTIGWSANIGFGQLTVYRIDKSTKEYIDESFAFDTECLSDEFRDEVLSKVPEYLVSCIQKQFLPGSQVVRQQTLTL